MGAGPIYRGDNGTVSERIFRAGAAAVGGRLVSIAS